MKINQCKADYDALGRVRDFITYRTTNHVLYSLRWRIAVEPVPRWTHFVDIVRTDQRKGKPIVHTKSALGTTLSAAINKAMRAKWHKV